MGKIQRSGPSSETSKGGLQVRWRPAREPLVCSLSYKTVLPKPQIILSQLLQECRAIWLESRFQVCKETSTQKIPTLPFQVVSFL